MAGKTIAERADAIAIGSGLYRLALIDPQRHPRPRRWSSLVVLLAIIGGYAWTVSTLAKPHSLTVPTLIAPLVFFGAFMAANLIRFAGPRLQPLNGAPLDERERAIKARAGHLSGVTITVMAIGGCLYQGVAPVLGWWSPRSPLDWIYLGLMLEGLAFVLPVFFASWMLPTQLPDDE